MKSAFVIIFIILFHFCFAQKPEYSIPAKQHQLFECFLPELRFEDGRILQTEDPRSTYFISDSVEYYARFQSPSGKVYIVPGFYTHGFQKDTFIYGSHEGNQTVFPIYKPEKTGWYIRFAFPEAGDWVMELAWNYHREHKIQLYKSTIHCEVASSSVFPIQQQGRYLKDAFGNPWYPAGINVNAHSLLLPEEVYPWFKFYIDSMAQHDINFFRVLAGGNYGWVLQGIFSGWSNIQKPRIHLNDFDDTLCFELDELLDECKDKGIAYMFHLFAGGNFVNMDPLPFETGNWCMNHYRDTIDLVNKWQGEIIWRKRIIQPGMLHDPADFFNMSNDRSRVRLYNYLRYIVARYGWNPALICWEPFGEIGRVLKTSGVDSFFDEKIRYTRYASPEDLYIFSDSVYHWLHQLDYFNRPVSSSPLGVFLNGDPMKPDLDENGDPMAASQHKIMRQYSDWVQTHSYGYIGHDTAGHITGTRMADTYRWHGAGYTLGFPHQLYLISEGGWPSMNHNYKELDPDGYDLHTGLFTSLLSGSAGAATFWDYGEMKEFHWFKHWDPLTQFLKSGAFRVSDRFRNIWTAGDENAAYTMMSLSNSDLPSARFSSDTLYSYIQLSAYHIKRVGKERWVRQDPHWKPQLAASERKLDLRFRVSGKGVYECVYYNTETGLEVHREMLTTVRRGFKYWLKWDIPGDYMSVKYGDVMIRLLKR